MCDMVLNDSNVKDKICFSNICGCIGNTSLFQFSENVT